MLSESTAHVFSKLCPDTYFSSSVASVLGLYAYLIPFSRMAFKEHKSFSV